VVAALCALVVCYGLATYGRSLHVPFPFEGDEAAFFDETCWIAEHGGARAFPRALFSGRYPYDNRHPLMQWLASPLARRDAKAIRILRAAKAVLAAAALAAVWGLLRLRLRAEYALALTALLALTENWSHRGAAFVIEPINFALVLAAWALIAGVWRPRGRWFWAGAMVGLAHLAKGTGMLLLFALVPALLIAAAFRWKRRSGFLRIARSRVARAGALLLVGFLITGGPWLWRNVVRFGHPFHSFNNALMWMDGDPDWQRPPPEGDPKAFTLRGYLRRHSAGDIVRRIAYGVWHQARRTLGFFAADRSFGRAVRGVTALLSLAVVLAGFRAMALRRHTWRSAYSVALLAMSFALFAWYSMITVSSRFMATFAAVVGWWAFHAGAGGLNRFLQERPAARAVAATAMAGIVAALLLVQGDLGRLGPPRDAPPLLPQAVDVLVAPAADGDGPL